MYLIVLRVPLSKYSNGELVEQHTDPALVLSKAKEINVMVGSVNEITEVSVGYGYITDVNDSYKFKGVLPDDVTVFSTRVSRSGGEPSSVE